MIEVRHVSHEFGRTGRNRSPLPVLVDVDLAVGDGMFVSFVGPSGCGKTTLLRIIHGLLRPAAGEVVIDGRAVRGPSAERAMVFQEVNLLPWRTSGKNAEFGLEAQGAPGAARRDSALAALDRVGLGDFGRHFPHQLSGGMKQLVGLARALCTTPRYLLMDEPFGSLDPQIRELMQLDLMKLWEADRKTVVFVTHSIKEAVFLSDRIVVLSARPARVLETIDVRLPRPRWLHDEQVKSSPEFIEYRRHVWRLLKQEIQRSGIAGSEYSGGSAELMRTGPDSRAEVADVEPPCLARADLTPRPPSRPGKGEPRCAVIGYRSPPRPGEGLGERSVSRSSGADEKCSVSREQRK